MDSNYVGKFRVSGGGDPDVTMHSVAPNAAGEYEVRGSFVAGATSHTLRLGGGYRVGDVWFDDIAVVAADSVATPYRGTYFDGDSTDNAFEQHDWLGTPNASKSTRTVQNAPERVIPPPYGYVKANNSKATLEIKYRSGWAG